MNFIDVFLIIILALGLIKGYLKGLIVEVFSLLAFFIGLFLAIKYSNAVVIYFFEESNYFHFISFGVFIVLFLTCVLLINIGAKVIKKIVDFTFLGFFDNVLGAIVGLVKWALIVSILLWVITIAGFHLPEDHLESSIILPYIESFGPRAFEVASSVFPFFNQILDGIEDIEVPDQIVLMR